MQIKEKLLSLLKMIGVYLSAFLPMMIMNLVFKLFPESFWNIVNAQEYNAYRILYISMAVSIQCIFIVFTMVVLIKLIFKTSVKRIGILFTTKWSRHLLIGSAIGCVPVLIIWSIIVIAGGYEVSINSLNMNIALDLLLLVPMMIVGSYFEEVMFRGTMAYAGRSTGRIFSIVVVSLLFAFMHKDTNLFSFINLALLGAICTQCTWLSGDIWMAIGCHASWNYMQGILGVPVSGTPFTSILVSNAPTNTVLNGGNFGIEASIPATVILALTILVIGMGWIRKKRVNQEPAADWLSK